MMQDQRVRNARGGGNILQPQAFGAALRDQLLRRVKDQLTRFIRRAPKAPRRCKGFYRTVY